MSVYLMDTPEEGARVERKTDGALTRDLLQWAGVGQGATVLDIGCANGATCRIMADIVGDSGAVFGVDCSEERVADGRRHPAHRPTIEYRVGDALNLPIDDASVDVAWSRFLFEYLESQELAVREMVRATRPGGGVCVGDLDGNCVWHDPIDPDLADELRNAINAFGASFDPHAGRRLYSLFHRAGLEGVRVDVRPYHIIAGELAGEPLEQWRLKLDGVQHALRRAGWSPARAQNLAQRFENHLRDPETFTYSVLITVCGQKPRL